MCNATLAQISDRYALPARLRGGLEIYTTRQSEKVRASVFEAYIAGVYYDFLRAGEQPSADTTDITDATHEVADDEDLLRAMIDQAQTSAVQNALATAKKRSGELMEPLTPTKAVVAQSKPSPSPVVTSHRPPKRPPVPDDPFAELLLYSRPRPSPSPPSHHSQQSSDPEDTSAILAPLMRQVGGPRSYPGRNRGQAFYRLELWLHPLYVPLAHWALGCMQMSAVQLESIALKPAKPAKPNGSVGKPEWEAEDVKAVSAPQLLQTFVIWRRTMSPSFISHFDPETGLHEVTCQMRPLPEKKKKKGQPIQAKQVSKTAKIASGAVDETPLTAEEDLNVPATDGDDGLDPAFEVRELPSLGPARAGAQEQVSADRAVAEDEATQGQSSEPKSDTDDTEGGGHQELELTQLHRQINKRAKMDFGSAGKAEDTADETVQPDNPDDRSTWYGRRFDNLSAFQRLCDELTCSVGTGVRGVKILATNAAAYRVLKQIGIAHWLRVEEGLVEDLFELTVG